MHGQQNIKISVFLFKYKTLMFFWALSVQPYFVNHFVNCVRIVLGEVSSFQDQHGETFHVTSIFFPFSLSSKTPFKEQVLTHSSSLLHSYKYLKHPYSEMTLTVD